MSPKIREKENRGRTVAMTPTRSKTWIKNIISHIVTKKREELPESTVTLSLPYEGRTGKALLTMLPVSSEQAQLWVLPLLPFFTLQSAGLHSETVPVILFHWRCWPYPALSSVLVVPVLGLCARTLCLFLFWVSVSSVHLHCSTEGFSISSLTPVIFLSCVFKETFSVFLNIWSSKLRNLLLHKHKLQNFVDGERGLLLLNMLCCMYIQELF